MAFGMKCPNNKGNVYARVSAVHEFLGDLKVTGGNGAILETDGKDTWVEYGLGVNFNLTPATYFRADVERISGRRPGRGLARDGGREARLLTFH